MQLNRTGNPITRVERNKINENWDKIEKDSTYLQIQVDNLVIENGTSDAEVVQARAEYSNLRNRLDTQFSEVNEKLTDIIQVSDFANGDGTNEAVQLQNALNAASGKTLIWNKQKGTKYVTRRLNLPSNIKIIFHPDVIIEASPEFANFENIFRIQDVENVVIEGNFATFNMRRDLFPEGEQRHGMTIWGAENVEVKNLIINNAAGDGILIGESFETPGRFCKNVKVEGLLIDNCKRVGIAVVGACNDIVINDVTVTNMNGGSVEAAIDIEPNDGAPENRRVTVSNCKFLNNPRGILVFDASFDVKIKNNYLENSGGIFVQKIRLERENPTAEITNNTLYRSDSVNLADSMVYIDTVSGVKIDGIKGENFAYPVYATNTLGGNTGNLTVKNVFSKNTRFGITLESVVNAKIHNCKVETTQMAPISTTGSSEIEIYDCEFLDYSQNANFTTSNGIKFERNKMRRGTKNINTAIFCTASSQNVLFNDNDLTDSALVNSIYSESPTVNYGFNRDIDGFYKPYVGEFNPALSKNLLGSLIMRTQNNRTQLQTVVERNGELAFVRIPTNYIGVSIPTNGTYVQGDVVVNTAPTELGETGSKYIIQGWTCIVAGAPGTWVENRILTGN